MALDRPGFREALFALAAALLALASHAAGGFPTLFDTDGDNDNLMRLVEVRDLIAGQGWFDLQQYRMGLDGGFQMHWSRLVDLPIALLAAGLGEVAAALIWPSLLFFCCLWLLAMTARSVHGPDAVLPAIVVGAMTLHLSGIFAPAAFDHHNVQLALALAMTACLVATRAGLGTGLAAGAAAALMLAVGAETIPIVAAGGAGVALAWFVRGEAARNAAFAFGLGFAATSLAAFVATVPSSAWFAAQCDAFSVAQALPALLSGVGLALASKFVRGGAMQRAAALVALGAAVALLVVVAFPHCLADPYADLPQRLRTYWLDAIAEAQSVADIWREAPALLARCYATPLLALSITGLAVRRRGLSPAETMTGILLLAAFLVSLWQVRGAVFALPLAVVPLSGWVASWRNRIATVQKPSALLSLRVAAVWLLSFNLVWGVAAGAALAAIGGKGASERTSSSGATVKRECYAAADFAALRSLAPATVASISNLGAPILGYTGHRALSGPYHRNQAGNLAALDIWLAPPDAAGALVEAAGASLIAVCPDNAETRFLARKAPQGLLAALAAGTAPDWLEPLPDAGDGPLRIYRLLDR